MKSQKQILNLLAGNMKVFEKELDIKIRNGQTSQAIKKTLIWVLNDENN